jgi:hypothetical protein
MFGKITNASEINTTNYFESNIGVLNIAPIKISGQYKIVVDINQKLWLDNYCGRRKAIDLSNSILPQISNFLSTETIITDLSILRYGGFSSFPNKWHIPLYLGGQKTTYPAYYCLARVQSNNIVSVEKMYEYGLVRQLIDIRKLGFHNIFDEMFSDEYFEFPIYNNWSDSKVSIYGYGIDTMGPKTATIDLTNIQANQNYFDIVNNTILNEFQKNKIFFPKFLNIEFEFETKHNIYEAWENYYGFLSNDNGKPVFMDFKESFYCKIKDFNEYIEWKNISKIEYLANDSQIIYDKYLIQNGTFTIQEVAPQIAQYSYKITRIESADLIQIYDYDDPAVLVFEYRVEALDIIKESLYGTLIKLITKLNKLTKNQFYFQLLGGFPNDSNFTLIIENRTANPKISMDEAYTIITPKHWINNCRYPEELENINKFRALTEYDIWVINNNRIDAKIFTINDELYTVKEYFIYRGKTIARLDRPTKITGLTYALLNTEREEVAVELKPINFFQTYSDLKVEEQYNMDLYCEDLKETFDQIFDEQLQIDVKNVHLHECVDQFQQKKVVDELPYVVELDDKSDLKNVPTIDLDNSSLETYQGNNILNMLFASVGQNCYIAPNTFNYDKQFYIQNLCEDLELLKNDNLRYHWFLINGLTPKSVIGTIGELRYFDSTKQELPKITSRIVTINKQQAETIFLGNKYFLPRMYDGYNFAVYLNPDNQEDIELEYKFVRNDDNKTLYLEINKYIDFSDLIRGGTNKKQPIIDLSFFYTVRTGFNEKSEYVYDALTTGLIICEPIKKSDKEEEQIQIILANGFAKTVYDEDFDGTIKNRSKLACFQDVAGKQWICVRAAEFFNNVDYNILIPGKDSNPFYIYSTIKYKAPDSTEKTYTYVSVEVIFKNIKETHPNYFWCEDIWVRFFNTDKIFVTIFDPAIQKYITEYVETKDLTNFQKIENEGVWKDYEEVCECFIDNVTTTLRLLAPRKTLKLKEEYFILNFVSTYDNDLNVIQDKFVFTFNDCKLNIPDYFKQFDYYDILSDKSYYSMYIDLFKRNQIWLLIKDLIANNVKIKYFSEEQVQKILSEFTITKLYDYSKNNSILIRGTNEYVKIIPVNIDKNVAIYNLLNKPNLFVINRHKTGYLPFFEITEPHNFQIKPFKSEIEGYQKQIASIYSNNYGEVIELGYDLRFASSTGIYKAIHGNLVSSIFCKTEEIKIKVDPYSNENKLNPDVIDYRKILYENILIDQGAIINNNLNVDYISKIDMNIESYIKQIYVQVLLDNFYYLSDVTTEFDYRLDFSVDTKTPTIIHLKPINSYNMRFNERVLIFKRK